MKKIILNLALAVSLIIYFGGCEKDLAGACKAGQGQIMVSRYPLVTNINYEPWAGNFGDNNEVYYQHIGSNVRFFIAKNHSNICTKGHLKINYYVQTLDTTHSLPLKIFAEAYWASYNDKRTLNTDIPASSARFETIMEVGLKQAFGDGPGDIELFLNVEFPKQATVEEDFRYFRRHISQIGLNFHYDNAD